jgi:hypothetical protein
VALPEDLYPLVLAHLDPRSLADLCAASPEDDRAVNAVHPLRERYVQVCYLLDATASMSFVMMRLAQYFKQGLGRMLRARPHRHVETAMVFFWDYDTPRCRIRCCDFGRPLHRLIAALECVYVGGGGDLPEAEKTGYVHALQNSWSRGPCGKVIVRVGDAPMHSDTHAQGDDIYGAMEKHHLAADYDASRIAQQLARKGIQVAALGVRNPMDLDNAKGRRMVRAMDALNRLMADATNGVACSVHDVDQLPDLIPDSIDRALVLPAADVAASSDPLATEVAYLNQRTDPASTA